MPHCGFLSPPSIGDVVAVLVFTFPGQGSQRSGMGEPWVDHPSWEVVEEASAATDRDLAHLLLRAEMEELTRSTASRMTRLSTVVASWALTFEHGIGLVVARGNA